MKKNKNLEQSTLIKSNYDSVSILQKVFEFLLLFMPKTLVKRVLAIVLLVAEVPVPKVVELSGLCDRSVRGLRKSLQEGEIIDLFVLKNGTGSRSKTKGIEEEILAELEKHNYYTQQQIADMIKEKFGVCVSTTAVARLLKKTASKS